LWRASIEWLWSLLTRPHIPRSPALALLSCEAGGHQLPEQRPRRCSVEAQRRLELAVGQRAALGEQRRRCFIASASVVGGGRLCGAQRWATPCSAAGDKVNRCGRLVAAGRWQSRLGQGDMGVNRARMEQLSAALLTAMER